MIVFDNGAYSLDNAKLLDSKGMEFVTRQQLNKTDDVFVKKNSNEWEHLDDNISFMQTKANLGRTRYIFRNEQIRSNILKECHNKLERDWNDMTIISKGIERTNHQGRNIKIPIGSLTRSYIIGPLSRWNR